MARSKKQQETLVSNKFDDVVDRLASETGVSPDDVRKLMSKLGLEQSLRKRAHEDERSGGTTLQNVTHHIIRIASSLGPI